ncbi:MAG: alpha-1,2-fucosyltransferase [Lachnospiraceae bacterium]|nr:alpha-1,2-fucosyltransferase [Lachnospiraceae bacterium]
MRVIVNLPGGFGNQLFAYAFGYALSQRLQAELYVDTSTQDNGIGRELELLNFNVEYVGRLSYVYKHNLINRAVFNKLRRRNMIGWATKMYCESHPSIYEVEVSNIKSDTYFLGSWQSEKYFREYRRKLLEMFQPKTERSVSVKKIVETVSEQNSVALHVRRGDYVSIGCQVHMDFYDKALQLLKEKLKGHWTLYVFSDDITFCRRYFIKYLDNISIVYPEYQSDNKTLDDFLIMSRCKHMIMANSTYSWWAAWLNSNHEKIVICPELGMWTKDFYPNEWIKIKA